MTYLFTINWTLLALATFLPMTHSFYLLLRIVVCFTIILYVIKAKKAHKIYDPIEYIFLAIFIVIYNPIFPLHRDAEVWQTINISTALLLEYMRQNLKDTK